AGDGRSGAPAALHARRRRLRLDGHDMKKVLRFHELAKRIAAQMKLDSPVVRAVLESKKTELPKATEKQIKEAARTLIHEELLRVDAEHHAPDRKSASHRSR